MLCEDPQVRCAAASWAKEKVELGPWDCSCGGARVALGVPLSWAIALGRGGISPGKGFSPFLTPTSLLA